MATETSALRTLVVEDDAGYAALLKELLTEGRQFTVEIAGTMSEALGKLAAGGFDLVLLDLHLPDVKGSEACETLSGAAPDVPLVIVSGSTEEDGHATTCLEHGAQDYLVKSEIDRKHLLHSVRYAIRRKKIETEYKAAQRALVDANKTLVEKVRELDRLNAIMMGREERILEMKEEIRALREQLVQMMKGVSP